VSPPDGSPGGPGTLRGSAAKRRLILAALSCFAATSLAVWWTTSSASAVALIAAGYAAGTALLWRLAVPAPGLGAGAAPAGRTESLVAALAAARAGDLTVRTHPESQGSDLAPLGLAIDEMLDSLAMLVKDLAATAAEVSVSAERVERHGRVLAERAGRQSAAVAEVARKLKGMGARSEEIGQIVELLEDVAAETNVLALNAALEASRAGAQGKGFGMVADEVRKLAERSAAATKDIGAFIQGIEATTDETTRSVDDIRALGEGVVASAVQTATFAATLLDSARGLSRTLLRLRVPGQDGSDLGRALRERRSEIARALEPLEPLLANAHTPLGDALKQVLVVLAEGNPRAVRSSGTAALGAALAASAAAPETRDRPAPPARGTG
jgi:methyl-accepting chemotaxis protein